MTIRIKKKAATRASNAQTKAIQMLVPGRKANGVIIVLLRVLAAVSLANNWLKLT